MHEIISFCRKEPCFLKSFIYGNRPSPCHRGKGEEDPCGDGDNRGRCVPVDEAESADGGGADYKCLCKWGFGGRNCSQGEVDFSCSRKQIGCLKSTCSRLKHLMHDVYVS